MKDRPIPQHLEALQRANEVRYAWANLKRRIKAGEVKLDDLLAGSVDGCDVRTANRYKAIDVVMAAHRVGRGVARRCLTDAAIPEAKRLGDLTARQRGLLTAAVRSRAPWACAAPARVTGSMREAA